LLGSGMHRWSSFLGALLPKSILRQETSPAASTTTVGIGSPYALAPGAKRCPI
jgi:hypothetical protein